MSQQPFRVRYAPGPAMPAGTSLERDELDVYHAIKTFVNRAPSLPRPQMERIIDYGGADFLRHRFAVRLSEMFAGSWVASGGQIAHSEPECISFYNPGSEFIISNARDLAALWDRFVERVARDAASEGMEYTPLLDLALSTIEAEDRISGPEAEAFKERALANLIPGTFARSRAFLSHPDTRGHLESVLSMSSSSWKRSVAASSYPLCCERMPPLLVFKVVDAGGIQDLLANPCFCQQTVTSVEKWVMDELGRCFINQSKPA